ncbi:MAG TPA: sulfite exporter TauE/SafE family protein, partial [Bacteroidia bacterium]|nr:sulfite exporter TauE/SafE family protein [Bacteroidia bacterium]
MENKKSAVLTWVILIAIGLTAGALSGLIGIGGGIVIVPALVFFLGFSQHEAQGTSIALMLPPIGILAAYNYYASGDLNINFAIVIACAFIVGAFFGSKIAIAMDEKKIRKIFGVIMLLIAIKM